MKLLTLSVTSVCALSLFVGCDMSSPAAPSSSASTAAYEAEYQRQMDVSKDQLKQSEAYMAKLWEHAEATDKLLAMSTEQARKAEVALESQIQHLEEYDRLFKKQTERMERFNKILEKWEQQAERQDLILKRQEELLRKAEAKSN